MKNLISIIILILFSSLLKSQTTIIDIENSGNENSGNYYRKDNNNILNPFQGVYIYNNSAINFKIILKKMIYQPVWSHYEDLIIGEYQYIENGIEKINTLSNLEINYSDQYLKHNIAGNRILWNNSRLWKCPECNPNEKRVALRIIDKQTNRYADLLMRRTSENGQEVLKVKIYNVSTVAYNVETESAPANFSLPLGEFTMIKQ